MLMLCKSSRAVRDFLIFRVTLVMETSAQSGSISGKLFENVESDTVQRPTDRLEQDTFFRISGSNITRKNHMRVWNNILVLARSEKSTQKANTKKKILFDKYYLLWLYSRIFLGLSQVLV